jgi:2-dehydro-3-deoxyphosphooctonate aldolase (KDO 8-P synthase)
VSALSAEVRVGGVRLGNHLPLALIGGLNVLDHDELNARVADTLARACQRAGVPLIFKASFDKANRSSHLSARGPGLERGLEQLAALKRRFALPILTDIHAPEQAAPVAEVADCLQIPAFLVRQTDLIAAACATGRPLHLKKMQCMAPEELHTVARKCEALGAREVMLCERGTLFGYHNLIVDPLSFSQLKQMGPPVTFDVTHALQQPGALGVSTGGRGHLTAPLMAAGVSQGIAALFLEVHPEPREALCDGPCALRLDEAEALLRRARSLDGWAKELSAPPTAATGGVQ